ncbi:hypothetical protein HMPREF0183_0082 [Brevibacterium mcbrellneri ATCC 49030]|uniref:Uncharacterized protein n=1 Tax=Brevibacterium mcbrellneri ATCC 49030 TaxID=585530 RepID=D4YJH2_9MICO|nr:hypothetical protein [Brevibacterium mcbrellneri]EFG48667.1 hypothetical protein HMPREF0183_0082 [Brevibacterium mcbrellneri ATCC 49030]
MDQRPYRACGGRSFERHDSVSQNTHGQPETTSAGAFHSTTHNPRRIRTATPATPTELRALRLPWFF